MSEARFAGRGLIVAGGTHGIGPAVVISAAKQGASIVFCGCSGSKEAGGKVIAEARAAGVVERVFFVPIDVSSEADIDRLFDSALDQLPDLYALISNVEGTGALKYKPLIETSLADWNEVLTIRLRKPFLLSRRAVEEFIAGGEGGRIVHITSAVDGHAIGRASYVASESALRAFIRSIAKEYGRRGIVCNAVAVRGDVDAEVMAPVTREDQRVGKVLCSQHSPCGAEAIANVVLFLASDEASFISGEMFYVGEASYK